MSNFIFLTDCLMRFIIDTEAKYGSRLSHLHQLPDHYDRCRSKPYSLKGHDGVNDFRFVSTRYPDRLFASKDRQNFNIVITTNCNPIHINAAITVSLSKNPMSVEPCETWHHIKVVFDLSFCDIQ